MPQCLSHVTATSKRCETNILMAVPGFATRNIDDVFVQSRAINRKLHIEVYRLHVRNGRMREAVYICIYNILFDWLTSDKITCSIQKFLIPRGSLDYRRSFEA